MSSQGDQAGPTPPLRSQQSVALGKISGVGAVVLNLQPHRQRGAYPDRVAHAPGSSPEASATVFATATTAPMIRDPTSQGGKPVWRNMTAEDVRGAARKPGRAVFQKIPFTVGEKQYMDERFWDGIDGPAHAKKDEVAVEMAAELRTPWERTKDQVGRYWSSNKLEITQRSMKRRGVKPTSNGRM